MNIGQQVLADVVKKCALDRAAKLRMLVTKGHKLSDLCLVRFYGFPSFHLEAGEHNEDGSYKITYDDKFRVELVKHMSDEEKKEWKLSQRPSGLWTDWRGDMRKKSWEI